MQYNLKIGKAAILRKAKAIFENLQSNTINKNLVYRFRIFLPRLKFLIIWEEIEKHYTKYKHSYKLVAAKEYYIKRRTFESMQGNC